MAAEEDMRRITVEEAESIALSAALGKLGIGQTREWKYWLRESELCRVAEMSAYRVTWEIWRPRGFMTEERTYNVQVDVLRDTGEVVGFRYV